MEYVIFAAFVVYFLWGMSSAHALAPNFDSLTAAVDYDPAIAAVLLVCAGLAGVYIVMSGASMILQRLRDPDYDADFAEWDSRR